MSLTSDKIREKAEDEDVSQHSQLRLETASNLLEIGDVSQIRPTFLGISCKLTTIDEFWVVRWKEGTKTHLPRRERSPPFFPFGRCALSGL